MDQQMKELAEMLTCQVCWETLTRPIFRCKNEHLFCKQCFQKIKECPSCRSKLKPNLRSISMERLTDFVRLPCEYSEVGCPELLQPKDKSQHEKTCDFGPGGSVVECPLVYSCSWSGGRGDVEPHVHQAHQNDLVVIPDGAFTATASSTTLLEFDSAFFVLRAESVTVADFTSHYVHVGHVAQGLRAAGTHYWFEVRRDPDGDSYKGPVTNYRQSLQDLAAAGSCLSFVTQADEPDEVTYSGTIKKLPCKFLIE